ncbi:MAG TPA: YeeE/YedE family protein [Xanthobacteraceae bacterium]|nr:YeeE/YedE family protein [Xanthobacteraceae bacterium]
MANFTPVSAAIGGALIGLAAVLLMLFTGRIAGISGIFGGLINPQTDDRGWRAAFIAGLIVAPLSAVFVGYPVPMPQMPGSFVTIVAGGLLVGFGTRLGSGCTSGHGICGIARVSPRSIAATCVFMAAAIAVVALTRHVFGG